MNILPAKVRCRLTGHRWIVEWTTARMKHGAPLVECNRCGEVGWVV